MAGPARNDIFGILLLVALLWLPLPGHAAKVLVLGDSLSAAYGLEQNQGWVALLATRLHQSYPEMEVINASISGETSAGGRSRINDLLTLHKPAIVILALGANDGLRGLPITELRNNLDYIITASQAHNAQVVLIGMRMPPNYGKTYTEEFYQTYHALADKYRLSRVPFLLAGLERDRTLFQADGLHPVAAAQPRLLDNVWPALQAALTNKPIKR